MTQVFSKAIEFLQDSTKGYTEPLLFNKYIADCGLTIKGTAANYISVQSYSDLRPELKQNNVMVFRLGSRKGEKGTYFGLAETKNGWQDYFLFNQEVFSNSPVKTIQIDWKREIYYSFTVIPSLTETSYVNLALASGVFEIALDLDSHRLTVPATGRGTYSFKVRPSSHLNAVWEHLSGQVEIDSVFIGSRQGKKCLFLVEAKSGKYAASLAKHKLMYPWLAVAKHTSPDYQVIPLYLLIDENEDKIRYSIAECAIQDQRATPPIDSLAHKCSRTIEIIK